MSASRASQQTEASGSGRSLRFARMSDARIYAHTLASEGTIWTDRYATGWRRRSRAHPGAKPCGWSWPGRRRRRLARWRADPAPTPGRKSDAGNGGVRRARWARRARRPCSVVPTKRTASVRLPVSCRGQFAAACWGHRAPASTTVAPGSRVSTDGAPSRAERASASTTGGWVSAMLSSPSPSPMPSPASQACHDRV